jgi:simple sugar transport system permease protein
MTTTVTAPAQPPTDERVARVGFFRRLLTKPEFGSLIGAIFIFLFFSILSPIFWSPAGISNWLDPASTIGIMAVAVALLMIGGHFDLSAGVMLGTAGLTTGILTTEFNLALPASMVVSLAVVLAVGFFNGFLVVRTGLPSFIITLGTFLMLQGLNLGLTKLFTGTVQVEGLAAEPFYDAIKPIFGSEINVFGQGFQISILWWIVFTAIGSYLLLRTRFGNWIFAVGGDLNASRNVGVPAKRTTIILFMTVAFCAWWVGNSQVLRLGSIQAGAGFGLELTYIVAAVIGGCLLTGGYGSVIGASLGALIFGMASQGIVYAGWDADWFKFFLGAMLLLAVLVNQVVRRRAEQSRRR